MKIEIKEGELSIKFGNIYDAVSKMSDEDAQAFADALAIKENVIKYVGQQILDGWTEHSSHGSIGWGARDSTELDKLVIEVAKRSGEIAAKQIIELQGVIKKQEARINELLCENSDLRRGVRYSSGDRF